MPGTDLRPALSTIERAPGRDFGDLFVTDYWRSPPVIDVLRAYFRRRERPTPDARGLAAIAIGWWACRVFGALLPAEPPDERSGLGPGQRRGPPRAAGSDA